MTNFIGEWSNADRRIKIIKENKTYKCSFEEDNLGIYFEDHLLISKFKYDEQGGGVGVYSPIGDGSSNYVLWSSSVITGELGSGITRKSDGFEGLTGEHNVTYYVGNNDGTSFKVRISRKSSAIYSLTWYKEDREILHGIGFTIGESLAFAWGNVDKDYDFILLSLLGGNQLQMQEVKWNDNFTAEYALSK